MGHCPHSGNGLATYSLKVPFMKLCSDLFGIEESRDYACDRYKTNAKGIVVVVIKAPQKDASNLKHIERMDNL